MNVPAKKSQTTASDCDVEIIEDFDDDFDDFLLSSNDLDSIDNFEEWPEFRQPVYKQCLGIFEKPLSLLIRELGRLIPLKKTAGIRKSFTEFHPFNMPDCILKNIEIVGIIVGLKLNSTYFEIQVYDGTATVLVLQKESKFKEDFERRLKIDERHNIDPQNVKNTERLMRQIIKRKGPVTQNIRQFQEANETWWKECKQGMLGKRYEIGDYVRVQGFCNLRANESRHVVENNDFWDSDMMPALIFNAYRVECITEYEHNFTLYTLLHDVVRNKYIKDEDKKLPKKLSRKC